MFDVIRKGEENSHLGAYNQITALPTELLDGLAHNNFRLSESITSARQRQLLPAISFAAAGMHTSQRCQRS
jgi:hypothetical protein